MWLLKVSIEIEFVSNSLFGIAAENLSHGGASFSGSIEILERAGLFRRPASGLDEFRLRGRRSLLPGFLYRYLDRDRRRLERNVVVLQTPAALTSQQHSAPDARFQLIG